MPAAHPADVASGERLAAVLLPVIAHPGITLARPSSPLTPLPAPEMLPVLQPERIPRDPRGPSASLVDLPSDLGGLS